jgi:hypothetical protein
MQQVATHEAAMGRGNKLGEWNWGMLAQQGREVLLEAGYQ